jgi:hypothetical protein
MNALLEIQNEAKVIVEQLAEREINRLKGNYNLFEVWMAGEGNPVIGKYDGKVDSYASSEKYVYMTQYKSWNHELSKYELPSAFPSNYRDIRSMYRDKSLSNMVYELRLLLSSSWESRYREDFIAQNMVKLNRALAKHIDNNMTASNIRVNVGGDGAEVLADVDGKLFKTFGTLCGGWVQCLHYRYRSSLK